jgi:hypothetical protein
LPARPEQWLTVPGWPAYEASDRGRVRSVDRELSDGRTAGGVVLKPARDKDGYRYVTLSDGTRRQRIHVGRAVLAAFAGEPPAGLEACHANGRRWDNRLANLRWGTRPENRADRERHRAQREARKRVAEAGETGASPPCPKILVSGKEGNPR